MTHRSGGARRGVPRAWTLPVLGLALIVAAALLGYLSRSVFHDFIAWWPVWLLLLGLTLLARGRRWGRVRVMALVPILWLIVLGLFVTGHVLGWPAMPSASTNLNGPQAGSVATGALSASIEGRLEVGSGQSGFLYSVEPVRRGGDIGPPVAVEQIQGANIAVAISPSEDPGLYTFAGWQLDLDEAPVWSLSLGGDVEADLSRLRLASLQLDGGGETILGSVTDSVVVTVSGDFQVTVPAGVPARVVGQAAVPAGWLASSDGFESPVAGSGWVISVGQGSSLTVIEG
ncbi:MAG: hypothetical protein ACRDX9_00400 [Acidimicrobiia bacterium]